MSEFSKTFAVVVQRRRKAKKLSRAKLAKRAGLHQTYIGLIERGERNPTLESAEAIAKALGTSLERLIREANKLKKHQR